jgi:DNA-cytosine methyltransferase
MSITYGDLLSGGGGCSLGAIAAGLEHKWGVELVENIADLYRLNVGHVVNKSILDCDPRDFEPVDFLHASPICTEFSSAKTNGAENLNDILCARKIAEFIKYMLPKYFTLENVRKYGKPDCISFQIILKALFENDYQIDYKVVNAKDFGVPQSRDRLILRAIRNQEVPPLPDKEPVVGWYPAIAHLVHDLPTSKLADWQIKWFPTEIRGDLNHALLIEKDGARSDRPLQTRVDSEPIWTVRAMGHKRGHWHTANAILFDEKPKLASDRPLAEQLLEQGRVVFLNNECFAELQTFPSYQWTGNKLLDGRIRGNSVPPLMYKKVVQSVINATN